jgi:hypothetical protein
MGSTDPEKVQQGVLDDPVSATLAERVSWMKTASLSLVRSAHG